LFLCSPWANGITGEIMYVDAGFNTVGMSPDLMLDE
ncbi:MAG: enoyl-[acyl-carrier-protein] reductase FabI, partial [Acinetobacter sp.]